MSSPQEPRAGCRHDVTGWERGEHRRRTTLRRCTRASGTGCGRTCGSRSPLGTCGRRGRRSPRCLQLPRRTTSTSCLPFGGCLDEGAVSTSVDRQFVLHLVPPILAVLDLDPVAFTRDVAPRPPLSRRRPPAVARTRPPTVVARRRTSPTPPQRPDRVPDAEAPLAPERRATESSRACKWLG
jgi:hypothetical protein